MKKYLKVSGIGLVALVIVSLLSFRIFGLEPQDLRPGLWLSGELVTEPVTDWTFTNNHHEIFVQTSTRYGIPHSITTYCIEHEGRLYLFSSYYGGGTFPDDRGWNRNVDRDPRVRLKIGDSLYDQQLVVETDDAIRKIVLDGWLEKEEGWTSPGLENFYVYQVHPRT